MSDRDEWIVVVPQMKPREAHEAWQRWCKANPEISRQLKDGEVEEDLIRDLDGKDASRIRIRKSRVLGAQVEWVVVIPWMKPDEAEKAWQRWCEENPRIVGQLGVGDVEECVGPGLDWGDLASIRIRKAALISTKTEDEIEKESRLISQMSWRNVRRQAEEAWRERDFQRVVELYASMGRDLTVLESRRLAYARKQVS